MGKEEGGRGEKEKGICCFEAREEGKAGALLFLSRLLFSSAEKKGTFLSRHRISPLLQEAKPSKLPWALTKKKPPHQIQQGQQNYLEDGNDKNLQRACDSGWWSAFGENKFLGVKPPAASDGISRRQLKASWKKISPFLSYIATTLAASRQCLDMSQERSVYSLFFSCRRFRLIRPSDGIF